MTVSIANPQNASAMIALADTLVPAAMGRVLMQTIVVAPPQCSPDVDPESSAKLQTLLLKLLQASAELGVSCETLTTVSPEPMQEIARVARLHRCESVLLGLSEIIVGVQRIGPREKLFGDFTRQLARRTHGPLIVISRRG